MIGQKILISKLRPTQMTLGLAEVKDRAAKIADLPPSELEDLLKEKAIPHVLGPGRQIYIVDHHHLARALWSLKISEAVLGPRLADWSRKEPKDFWHLMEQRHLCWPIDAEGNRRPFAAIPTSIADLTDNIWRTLGRHVRGKAFENLGTPYQEFMWGDYFRTFMSRRLIELEFDLAAQVANKLARLPEAQDLPGYWG